MKQKTNKSAASRFRVTKNGKVLHRSHHIRHLRSNKSKSQLRRLKKMKALNAVFGKKIRQLLGKA